MGWRSESAGACGKNTLLMEPFPSNPWDTGTVADPQTHPAVLHEVFKIDSGRLTYLNGRLSRNNLQAMQMNADVLA